MSTTTNEKSGGIPVRIFTQNGETNRGFLYYRNTGPAISLEDNCVLEELEGVKFSFIDNSELSENSKIKSGAKIFLKPEVIAELGYSPKRTSQYEMYPPSSEKWLTHVVDSGLQSVFTVQRIDGQEKKLLTIVDKTSLELYHLGLVHSYEPSILMMDRDWNVNREILYSVSTDTKVFKILEERPLSWSTLSKLVEGVTIPNLSIQDTMEETLDQLVPQSFSRNVRRQIMAFLGWLENAKIPDEDPSDFVMKYQSVPIYRVLARGHIQCMLDHINPPDYVRIMHLAVRNQLELTQRPKSEATEMDPWTLVRLKLNEMFPDWMGLVIKHALALHDRGQINTELPVSRAEAKLSRQAWSERFAIANHALFMRGHVHKAAIGLAPAIYIGSAHRWPHKHLDWSARLGYETENPQYVQIMVMPASAFERVSRIIPTVRLIEWEMSTFNLSLYSEIERKWKMKSSIIAKSIERRRSIKQLSNEFGCWKEKDHYSLSQQQARILDLISWAMYLSSLESNRYAEYYRIDNSTIKNELDNMLNRGVFELQYFLIPEKLRSLCFIANGPKENICSLSRSFLKHAPSTQVRIMDEGNSCVIISRIPEDEHYSLVTNLASAAEETEISLRTMPISAYAGYRNNLYSRLLRMDGTWDDDVSGLLSQVRLRFKDEH